MNTVNYKRFAVPLCLKNIDQEGVIQGYASTYGTIDHHQEVIEKNAFKRTLNEWRCKNKLPKMLWQHSMVEPIGVWEDLKEDSIGLKVKGRLLLDVQKGKEAYALLKSGAVDGLSIGFRVAESYVDKSSKVRIITDLDLYEISLVTYGANPEAQVTSVKYAEKDASSTLLQGMQSHMNGGLQWHRSVVPRVGTDRHGNRAGDARSRHRHRDDQPHEHQRGRRHHRLHPPRCRHRHRARHRLQARPRGEGGSQVESGVRADAPHHPSRAIRPGGASV